MVAKTQIHLLIVIAPHLAFWRRHFVFCFCCFFFSQESSFLADDNVCGKIRISRGINLRTKKSSLLSLTKYRNNLLLLFNQVPVSDHIFLLYIDLHVNEQMANRGHIHACLLYLSPKSINWFCCRIQG